MGAVHIVHGEKKPKCAFLQTSHSRGIGPDNERLHDPDRARGNRFSSDVNETQSAGGVRVLHAFKVAEVRDINTVT
jgi:hypothetical protein